MTSTFKTAKINTYKPMPPYRPDRFTVIVTEKNQCPQPCVVKASTRRLPQAFPSYDATSKASTKFLPGRRRELLEQQMINASGDAQEALADKVERLIKLRAPAPSTASKRGRVLQPAHQESLESKMGRPSHAQWMTEYKENFGFSQTVHSPPAPKKGVPPLPTNLLDRPEARFADKYRRTEYQTAYGCKGPSSGSLVVLGNEPRIVQTLVQRFKHQLRTSHFNLTLYRQIRGKA